MGADEQKVLLGTDAGYGFVGKIGDLFTKNKAGKAVVSIPKGGRILSPKMVNDSNAMVAAVSNEGPLIAYRSHHGVAVIDHLRAQYPAALRDGYHCFTRFILGKQITYLANKAIAGIRT